MESRTVRRPRLLQWTLRVATLLGAAALAMATMSNAAAVFLVLGLLILSFLVGLIALSRRDAQAVLTLLLLLLFLVPENYVLVGPLRSVGQPALLVGMMALALWAAGRILGLLEARRGHPVRWMLLAYAITTLISFAAGMSRTLTGEESAGAVRALFPVVAMLGIGLLALDGLESRQRVESLLERLVLIGGVAAAIGILEFFDGGFVYSQVMHLPGLTSNTTIINDTRSGFSRIDGAAAHPIEYAVVIACLAPLALHLALNAPTPKRRHRCALALTLMLVVSPMSVSRSGILALAVGLAIYVAHLSGRARFNALVVGVIGIGVFRAMVPGLLGTLKSLFLVGEDDPSIAGRTEDYAQIPGLLEGHVWFGRGLGTFQPTKYFFLDNQYLGSLLEGGVLALAVLIGVYVTGMCVARGVRHRTGDPALRGLAQALVGAIAALAVSAVTFDELGFLQTAFVLFLLLGCAGALWTLVREAPRRHPSGEVRQPEAPPTPVPVG
ncbi:O-antigen ligase family protein [Nocardioides sp. YIM 152315]|uniref:O-antigen ligase family protein n=1 Tax=Nocardioides sp. YIM 152315 TaxID=3031760 RepID=UPI0023DADE73|nr:O-antigen ligase family protein [Nocardioides sp. YIM 152315]MDF1603450.1 O-antigen ligase family protein [Nocardioides sp. YIM 152315]